MISWNNIKCYYCCLASMVTLYLRVSRVCLGLISKSTNVFPFSSFSVHLTTPSISPNFCVVQFFGVMLSLSKMSWEIFCTLFALYNFPYHFSGVMVMVLVFPTFIPTTPLSKPRMTCPDPTVKISGFCSVFWSKICPLENVAIYVMEIISHAFTLFLLAHHAITKRDNDAIARKPMIFFMMKRLNDKTLKRLNDYSFNF